jgi:hypothetical protein
MRFRAPLRDAVDAARFAHPGFADFAAHRDWLCGPNWPTLDALNQRLGGRCHPRSGKPLRFVAQTPDLLADGSHYEARIHAQGTIATRECNWHDLLNALIWLERTALKGAVNQAYACDIPLAAPGQRTRRQCALTHFDEGGALVRLRDPRWLAAWDAHDWHGLYAHSRAHWLADAQVWLFGHALLEQLLWPDAMPVAKCLVLVDPEMRPTSECMALVADAIASGHALNDPQELRPLPLAGLAGWHARATDTAFYREAPCFRPVRAGRRYPAPLQLAAWSPASLPANGPS